MAYSDYGGYGYKNGERVVARSDAVITDKARSQPGMFPGFAFAAQGLSASEAAKTRYKNPNGHVVLGDSPLYVGLYKQAGVSVWHEDREIELGECENDCPAEFIDSYDDRKCINGYEIADADEEICVRFKLPSGARMDVAWTHEDNYYQFVRLDMPNGDLWAGWSGYGVGARLENAGYGFSTQACEDRLEQLWPDAVGGADPSVGIGDL